MFRALYRFFSKQWLPPSRIRRKNHFSVKPAFSQNAEESVVQVLRYNTSALPPNDKYMETVKHFYASRLFFFRGSPWQLRTLCQDGRHYVVPLLVNTGEHSFGDPSRRHLRNFMSWERDYVFSTPLGDSLRLESSRKNTRYPQESKSEQDGRN